MVFFPPIQRSGGWGRCSRVAHLPSMYGVVGSRPSISKRRKSHASVVGFFRLFLFFRAFALSKPASRWAAHVQHQPAAQVVRGHNSQPRRAPRSCAPCRRGPGVPRYLNWAPPEAVDGVGICAGFQELPHRLHLPPRGGGGQARVTAAAQHVLVLFSQPRRGAARMVLRLP